MLIVLFDLAGDPNHLLGIFNRRDEIRPDRFQDIVMGLLEGIIYPLALKFAFLQHSLFGGAEPCGAQEGLSGGGDKRFAGFIP